MTRRASGTSWPRSRKPLILPSRGSATPAMALYGYACARLALSSCFARCCAPFRTAADPHGPVPDSPYSIPGIPSPFGVSMKRFSQWLCAGVLFATSVSPLLAQTIRLGELNSYKTFPAFLEPYRRGMQLAQDEINAAGGVLGKRIEIVSRDDNGNPGDAVRVAEELLSREKVAFLVGTFPSNVGLA